jgi:hypothetical protein
LLSAAVRKTATVVLGCLAVGSQLIVLRVLPTDPAAGPGGDAHRVGKIITAPGVALL